MNLKDFLNNREKPPELYWSLVIERGWVQAGIWYIGTSALEMLNISPPAAWQIETELVGACDAALSSSVAKLPENYAEPNKTVFGVSAKWVKDGEISDEYLALIKQVCTDLSLVPVGFVVLPEAIAHLYKSEEGTPLSAVIVGLGSDTLEISVFKLGNLAGTTSVARSISLTEDVVEGLSRFEGAAPLPSRIIVYDGKGGELEDAKEELMKAAWDGEGKIKFLHTPKAEILTSDRKVLATSLAGANEIGDVTKVNSPVEIGNVNKEIENSSESSDVLPEREEIENIKEPEEPVTAEELGYVIDGDVTNQKNTPPVFVAQTPPVTLNTQNFNPEPQVNINQEHRKVGSSVKSLFHGFSSKIHFHNPKVLNSGSKSKIYFIIAGLILIICGIGAYLWFVPSATVTVFVSPKKFQEQVALSFNLDGKFDESKAIIPGIAITSVASGEKTKSTTGTKLVGEKAKGSVQIVNGNGNPINLASGTILTSSAGLKFITDSSASVSGQLIPGSPGTATLSVTANDLGAQYNLAKGEVFKVGLFDKSQVAATSQVDFSGGSSQQIAAVSAADQQKLSTDLKNELSARVLSDLSSKIDSDQVFINDLASLSVTSETFDHKVGDVADTLKLSLKISGNGVAADKAKLVQYATDSLKSKIPQGYSLRSSQINFKFTYTGKQDGNLGYNADIIANFLPLLTTEDLTKKISGKKTSAVVEYLSTIQGYSRAEIKLNPKLPGPFQMLPYSYKNIKIDVVPEE